jgi:flagellar biosynthesis/type III secretory pathway M-ring protein FliF/YscJ
VAPAVAATPSPNQLRRRRKQWWLSLATVVLALIILAIVARKIARKARASQSHYSEL